MKGNLVSLLIRFGCTATIAAMTLVGAQAQDVVINELNLITGPDVGQFVELYGDPGTSLDGHSLVLVKSTPEGGNFMSRGASRCGLGRGSRWMTKDSC